MSDPEQKSMRSSSYLVGALHAALCAGVSMAPASELQIAPA